MTYFENFFRFPSVEADMENEWVKKASAESMSKEQEFNVDYVISMTEISSDNEVMSISEGWYPNEYSFNDVKQTHKFPCTRVNFSIEGDFLVNWPLKEFKVKWQKFQDSLPQLEVIELNEEEAKDLINKYKK
jgi:hypothetical protein